VDDETRTWLSNKLSSSDKEHVFVATHEPAFKIGKAGLSSDPCERNPFWEILEDEPRCRLYFCGHAHFYDHARLDDGDENPDDDVHQMVIGTAGAPLYNDGAYNETDPWEPIRIEHEDRDNCGCYEDECAPYCHGYVVVEVWGDNVTTHWKRRANVSSSTPSTYEPGGEGDNGDVFEYSVP